MAAARIAAAMVRVVVIIFHGQGRGLGEESGLCCSEEESATGRRGKRSQRNPAGLLGFGRQNGLLGLLHIFSPSFPIVLLPGLESVS
jgi:hypothetical protein